MSFAATLRQRRSPELLFGKGAHSGDKLPEVDCSYDQSLSIIAQIDNACLVNLAQFPRLPTRVLS